MAVMRNSIIFGGVNSADFGIYIGGEGTFDAPKRDVEMISIPGRNGALALDKGRYENIEVTYSAFNYETDLATFAKQLSDFRNAICSQKGYQRLTDTFHLEEYRMAAYIDGLEIKPINFNTASTFDIVFNCKPQRYLLDGEEAIDVDSGDVILNPTLFESSPMLEVGDYGYGDISFNGNTIHIEDGTIGDITLVNGKTEVVSSLQTYHPLNSAELLNVGDSIFVKEITGHVQLTPKSSQPLYFSELSHDLNPISDQSSGVTIGETSFRLVTYPTKIDAYVTAKNVTFTYDTANEYVRVRLNFDVKDSGGTTHSCWLQILFFIYSGSHADDYMPDAQFSTSALPFANRSRDITYSDINADSTVSRLGNPTYIDCELGEAYMIKDGRAVSLNHYIDLGSKLPTLAPSSNEITYDNTITDLKLIPRWWKI